jgi:hypothetical protein
MTFGGQFLHRSVPANDWEPLFEEDELMAMVLSVASGAMNKPELIEGFETRCQPLEGA